jgi:hypothetical protein
MKIKYIYLVFSMGVILFLAFTAAKFSGEGDECKKNGQVIKFSHALHSELQECAECHSAAGESTDLRAGSLLPKKENCAGCHDVDDADNCESCHFTDVYEPLVRKESELIFNHKFHAVEGNMTCIQCHQGINEVEYSFQAAGYKPPMALCNDCHSEKKIASNACESCHISTTNLVPQSHKTGNYVKLHKFHANKSNADCAMCHDQNSCDACHTATNTMVEVNLANDFYRPYETYSVVDGAKIQKVARVHDINYRFTHGMDLRGKTSDCTTCHQTETFCVTCHTSDYNDYALSGTMPATHKVPGFFTFGVGSGGGEHAKLAKRDIERCTACHDVNGNDPSCVMCHYDHDGIKGTNPKTHVAGFLKDIQGDWHYDDNAVCFNCHTDSGARFKVRSTGFCAYCHN